MNILARMTSKGKILIIINLKETKFSAKKRRFTFIRGLMVLLIIEVIFENFKNCKKINACLKNDRKMLL